VTIETSEEFMGKTIELMISRKGAIFETKIMAEGSGESGDENYGRVRLLFIVPSRGRS